MEFSKLGVKFRNEVLGIDSENGALEIGDVCLKMRLWERVFWNEDLGMQLWKLGMQSGNGAQRVP